MTPTKETRAARSDVRRPPRLRLRPALALDAGAVAWLGWVAVVYAFAALGRVALAM